jgi:hypothetical protein
MNIILNFTLIMKFIKEVNALCRLLAHNQVTVVNTSVNIVQGFHIWINNIIKFRVILNTCKIITIWVFKLTLNKEVNALSRLGMDEWVTKFGDFHDTFINLNTI